MGRDCAKKLDKIASIIRDVSVDVTLLTPLVDDFIVRIVEVLSESIKEGKMAEKLLENLQD